MKGIHKEYYPGQAVKGQQSEKQDQGQADRDRQPKEYIENERNTVCQDRPKNADRRPGVQGYVSGCDRRRSVSYAIAWAGPGPSAMRAAPGHKSRCLAGMFASFVGRHGASWSQFAGVRIQSRQQFSRGKGQAAACTAAHGFSRAWPVVGDPLTLSI